MTRFDIALNKDPIEEGPEVFRKIIVLKRWKDITLEKSPKSATCKWCRRDIFKKTLRYTVIVPLNRRFYETHYYHRSCLPKPLINFIQKKEKILS